jgi:hypothetical protein
MDRYAQIALDHNRRHRPVAYSQIRDPERFFEEAGEQIAAEVTRLRDDLLGPIRAGETPEDYRHRSYQALRTAEELTLANHHLFQAEPTSETDSAEDDPALEAHHRRLDQINRAINAPL